MASEMTIRDTQEDDWQTLKAIRLAALLDAPTAFGVTHAEATQYTESEWRDRAAGRGPARYLLAFADADDIALGIAAYVPLSDEAVNLIAMWVSPAARGTPMAGALVQAVKVAAAARGHARIALEVAPSNARAAAFYQKQGFAFLPEWEPLASHPHIQLQKMHCVI